ncbi:hypothetical protein F5Y08DRAFT_57781 [Xylaria arbuscula]|nr:hypothetical protein F5Y08DRAFT_57781 [Xylaria arbuscula]
MADEVLVSRVRALGDVDLAALLCLISREHCIISTDPEYLDDLTVELQLVASRTFGLNSVIVDCTPETTLDDLIATIQLPPQWQPTPGPNTPSPLHARSSESYFSPHPGGKRHQQGGSLWPSSRSPSVTAISPLKASFPSTGIQQTQIANVILARNLDTAPKAVQIQCLELMRTRRIITRTAVQACPKQFLLIAVLGSQSAGEARLTKHLNDHFYISHWQDPEDGFGHMDEDEEDQEQEGGKEKRYPPANDHEEGVTGDVDRDRDDDDDDAASQASSESVVRRTTQNSRTPSTPIPTSAVSTSPDSGYQQHTATRDWAVPLRSFPPSADTHGPGNTSNSSATTSRSPPTHRSPVFTETEISTLSTLSLQTHVDIEVQRYQMNIIAFLRMHRAVAPGSVPPAATTHFRMLIRSLATLHGLDFVTPELVQLAARKIYAHRIAIVPPERERSMQWGSDLHAVKAFLEGVQPEDVVEEVLSMVDVPL